VALAGNELEAARTSLRRSLELAGRGADPGLAIAAANALALAEAAAGEHDAAVRLLETALEQSRESGSRHLEAAIENNLADVLHAAGRQGDSMEHQRRAAALFAEVGGMPDLLDPAIWQLTVW
jgi:tetratricopeptide (TPR) repeat protein